LRRRVRQSHLDGGEEIACTVPFEMRHPEPTKSQPGSVLRSGWDRELRGRAPQRRDADDAARDRGRQLRPDTHGEVVPGAREDMVRPDVDADEEVATGPATPPGAALTGGAHACTLVDALRDLHLDPSWTIRRAQVDRECGTRECVLQADLGLAFDVLAAARHAASLATGGEALRGLPATEELLEEIAERRPGAEHALELVGRDGAVAELLVALEWIRTRATGALPLLVLLPARSQLVVLLPLLGIAEHLIGLVDLLETILGGL